MSASAPPFYHPAPRRQTYCNQCGAKLTRLIPPDDNRIRDVCTQCGAVHYQNPRNVVGVIPVWGDQVLLCKRAIAPRAGKWTLPAGFMELGESTAQGALRETQEEAGVQVAIQSLYTVVNVAHVDQVHFFYLARVLSPELNPGSETLEARFFDVDAIPWDDLAFLTVSSTLRHYVQDKPSGSFNLHHYTVS